MTPDVSIGTSWEDEAGAPGLMDRARDAARLGRRAEAQRLYEQAIFVDPDAEQAWLELAEVVEDPVLSRALYGRILRRWPASLAVAQALAALEDSDHAIAEPVVDVVPITDPVERMAMDIARAGAPIYRGARGVQAPTPSPSAEGTLAEDYAGLPGTLWLIMLDTLVVMGLIAAVALLLR